MHIEVSAPARLHLGDIDPFGVGRFGYAPILAINKPRTIVEAEEAETLNVEGPYAEEGSLYAKRVLETYGLRGARVVLRSLAPRHCGFGSTTQLCLAIGKAITTAYHLNPTLQELVKILKHTTRGGIYAFQLGGFIIAGGTKAEVERRSGYSEIPIPPMLLHHEFPDEWRFVVARPVTAPSGLNGEKEEGVFINLSKRKPPVRLIQKGYFLLASKLLPALIERDAEAFGKALTDIQINTGRVYLPVQGGLFNPSSQWLIRMLKQSGALGIGQSSWGPTVYAFIDSPDTAQKLADNVLRQTGKKASVEVVAADNKGAVVRTV